MLGTRKAFLYFQCSVCACLQIAEIPGDLSQYYDLNYYSFKAPTERSWLISKLYFARDSYAFTDAGLIGRMIYSLFPRGEYRFLSKLKLSKSDRILDVGCGAGQLLHALWRVGFHQLTGLDPYIDVDINYPNSFTIHKASLSEFSETQNVVMFNHSLEHMPDQRQALEDAARLVASDGVVIVRVPTVSSYAWRHYGTDWVQLDAPRHLFLHSRESMQIVASQAGLEMFDCFYDSEAFQFWGSEQYRQGISLFADHSYAKNPDHSLFTKADIKRFRVRATQLNMSGDGDQLVFYFRKILPLKDGRQLSSREKATYVFQ